jgi:hypothetical protein
MHKQNCINYLNCENYHHNLEPRMEFDCRGCKFCTETHKDAEEIIME